MEELSDNFRGLKMLFAFGMPGGRTKIQKQIGKYLDGDDAALNMAPNIRQHIDEAVTILRKQS